MRYLAVLITLALTSPLASAVEMIWPPGSYCEYTGEVKEGKPHGTGSTRCTNGSSYVGEWKDGTEHGQGIAYDRDGSVYRQGWWCNHYQRNGPCPD